MNQNRRTFLKGSLAGSVLAVAAGAGMLSPGMVLAAWPKSAFDAKSIDSALKSLLGMEGMKESTDIKIKTPDIAENGAVVPVSVTTAIKNAESITVLIHENGSPLAFNVGMTNKADGYVVMRVKMAKTSKVSAIVKAGGKLHSTSRNVKVTLGGCGG